MNATSDEAAPQSTENTKPARKKRAEVEDALVRGALKIEVTTSTDLVSAGKEFSIYVVIHNPFDVPITLHRTETHIPVELSDELAKTRLRNELQAKRRDELEKLKSIWAQAYRRFRYWAEDIRLFNRDDSGERVAEAVGVEYDRVQRATTSPTVTLATDAEGTIEVRGNIVAGDLWDLDFSEMPAHEIRQILWDIDEYKRGKSPVILQPGNSRVRHFVLKTTSWLAFTPLAHTFQIQVSYDVKGKNQTDTVPFSVNIQASMLSSLIGAIIGSLLGSFVRNPPNPSNLAETGRTMLTAAIFAVIIVVAFARKSNVQQIISVEDFWGGIFIGFLTGYSGEAFISSILGNPG